ncbi:MAG: glycosyltransferase family A protein [Cyanobacteria bacterium P01_G01_bin.39]
MANTQITVVVTTFKRGEYLTQAIASIGQQTYSHFECLIVNDYPPDAAILEQKITSLNDDRFKLINRDRSGGGNAARNTGITAAQGEIIAFLDDDDLWLPQKLQQHLEQHEANPQAGLVFSGILKRWEHQIIPDKRVKAELPSEGVVSAMSQGKFCPVTTSSVTVRRKCFSQCGLFDVNLTSFQDWDMWYRIAREFEFDCIESALTIFRQHLGDRTSKTKTRRLQGLNQLIDKWQFDLDNAQQFEALFIKDTYVNSIYDSILRSQRKAAFQDWYTLLKLSQSKSDILLLIKLMLMWLINAKNYGRLAKATKL